MGGSIPSLEGGSFVWGSSSSMVTSRWSARRGELGWDGRKAEMLQYLLRDFWVEDDRYWFEAPAAVTGEGIDGIDASEELVPQNGGGTFSWRRGGVFLVIEATGLLLLATRHDSGPPLGRRCQYPAVSDLMSSGHFGRASKPGSTWIRRKYVKSPAST